MSKPLALYASYYALSIVGLLLYVYFVFQPVLPQAPKRQRMTVAEEAALPATWRYIDALSLTAILPVTNESIHYLDKLLQPILGEETSVGVVYILSQLSVIAEAKSIVSAVADTVLPEIRVLPWADGVDEALALYEATLHVKSEWTLVLNTDGLSKVESYAQDVLLSPSLMELPLGPCGVESGAGWLIDEFRSAKFLLPPFVVSTTLLQAAHSGPDIPSPGLWSELGSFVAGARYDGAGGLLIGSGDDELDWCQEHLERLSPGPGDLEVEKSTFAIILPSLLALQDFAPVICRLAERNRTRVLLPEGPSIRIRFTSSGPVPLWEDKIVQSTCNISLSWVPADSDLRASVAAWLGNTTDGDTVVIFSPGKSLIHVGADLQLRRHLGAVIVEIPEDELFHAEWMGSLSLPEWQNWHIPKLQITVITNDRPQSLSRLLSSLQSALYFGDKIHIRINMEQTVDADTQQLVSDFKWPHGEVYVHRRVVKGGLVAAVIESWYPHTDVSYGLILEDDVEVSTMFYAWIKMSLLHYRHGEPQNRDPSLFGISLYQQRNIELLPEGRQPFDARSLFRSLHFPQPNTPFLSQIPCSWGAVYFPEQWREFHDYLSVRLSRPNTPQAADGALQIPLSTQIVPDVRSNRWSGSWKKHFIELTYLRGYVMLYPNYDNFISFSTNHLEVGSHVTRQPLDIYYKKRLLFEVPLMEMRNKSGEGAAVGILDMPEKALPRYSDLPMLDLFGKVVNAEGIKALGDERLREVTKCENVGLPFSCLI